MNIFRNFYHGFVEFLHTITIEPMIVLYSLGINFVAGSNMHTNLLIQKACEVELEFNQTICDNLNDDEYEDQKYDVERVVNNFQLVESWIYHAPTMVYVFFVGALADKFGKKPLILFPLMGSIVSCIFSLINIIFFYELPLEFFYMEDISSFFGGSAVYYLGLYGFGSKVSRPKERAHRLTRLDGVDAMTAIVGTAISPYLYNSIDYIGSYSLRLLFYILAFLYLLLIVKEPKIPKPKKVDTVAKPKVGVIRRMIGGFNKYVIQSTVAIWKTITKKRDYHMRELIILQFTIYGLYVVTWGEAPITYLYMVLVFDADGGDYALMSVVSLILSTIGLLFIMPLLTGKLGLHEGLVACLINISMVIGLLGEGFAKHLWPGFYLGKWATFMGVCIYGIGRALVTKSVTRGEIGKILSGNAILGAFIPFAGSPLFRLIYDATLETAPATIIFITAVIMSVTAVGNFFLFTKRDLFRKYAEKEGLNNPITEPLKDEEQGQKKESDKDDDDKSSMEKI